MGKRFGGRFAVTFVFSACALAGCAPSGSQSAEPSHPGLPEQDSPGVLPASTPPDLPVGWSLQEEDSVQVLQRKGARVVITIEPTTGAQATVRLREMAAEWPGPVATLTMAGWPAIQRSRQAATPSTGAVDPVASFVLTHVTTAVAAGSRLIRLEATLSPVPAR